MKRAAAAIFPNASDIGGAREQVYVKFGYAKAFQAGANDEWGGKIQSDIVDGKNWAITQGYVDPKRVRILNSSTRCL
jgi:hypothetical protein